MKRSKYLILFSVILFLTSITIIQSEPARTGDEVFDAQVNTLKQECKNLIKGTRYEGSKVTYYSVGNEKQTKAIEVFMFLPNEYQFAVSTKKCSVPTTLRFYDAASDVDDRTLIKEIKNTQGKNVTFSSVELNKLYRKKVPEVERIKNLHLEYTLAPGKTTAKEAVVLVMGYKP